MAMVVVTISLATARLDLIKSAIKGGQCPPFGVTVLPQG